MTEEKLSSNPVQVEVWRGELVESIHRGAFAVVDKAGNLVAARGDVEVPVYPRSSMKPVQAMWLIESGAADHFNLGPKQLAVACASHNGELQHTETVASWLNQIGLDETHLECGAHAPTDGKTRRQLIRDGINPGNLHNNCSGKHTGFLCACVHAGIDTRGYINPEHPIQQKINGVIEAATQYSLASSKPAIDGCGIPLHAIPLYNLALAFAGFTGAQEADNPRKRIVDAMLEEPFMVAGSGRFCTRVMQAGEGGAIVKTGAEGVYTGCLLKEGYGIALKIDDGATRAAEVLMADLLRQLTGNRQFREALDSEVIRPVKNVAGKAVGKIVSACAVS